MRCEGMLVRGWRECRCEENEEWVDLWGEIKFEGFEEWGWRLGLYGVGGWEFCVWGLDWVGLGEMFILSVWGLYFWWFEVIRNGNLVDFFW